MSSSRAVGCGTPVPRESAGQVLVERVPHELGVRRDVENVVPLVLRRRHRAVQAGGRVPERRVDEPPLSFTERDVPAVPDPGVPGLPVPLEVSDVSGFEVDGVAVVGTQDRDACVRPVRRASAAAEPVDLRDEERGKRCANEKRRANDPEPTMLS